RRDYDDPRVDLAVLRRSGAKVAAWADRLLVPKVLVATQTPVIEVVADPDGTLMPLTPVLAVIPPPDLVWEVAGLLSAPSISAWAAAHTLGTGRHRGVIKLAAREVRLLPGLDDPSPWSSVARLARRAQEAAAEDRWRSLLIQTAAGADRILGVSAPAVAEWWRRRAGLADPGVGLRRGR
ncbi:MAG: hypothetical protein OEW85_14375, partial [Acidimicrobiia bacterium]|nr:hypothetical protein [Acidimicrobiia bacterium]